MFYLVIVLVHGQPLLRSQHQALMNFYAAVGCTNETVCPLFPVDSPCSVRTLTCVSGSVVRMYALSAALLVVALTFIFFSPVCWTSNAFKVLCRELIWLFSLTFKCCKSSSGIEMWSYCVVILLRSLEKGMSETTGSRRRSRLRLDRLGLKSDFLSCDTRVLVDRFTGLSSSLAVC